MPNRSTLNGWLKRNFAWLLTTIFLAGGLVATWSMHLRASAIHVSVQDRERWVRIEAKLEMIDLQIDQLRRTCTDVQSTDGVE